MSGYMIVGGMVGYLNDPILLDYLMVRQIGPVCALTSHHQQGE